MTISFYSQILLCDDTSKHLKGKWLIPYLSFFNVCVANMSLIFPFSAFFKESPYKYSSVCWDYFPEKQFLNYSLQLLVIIMTGHRFITFLLKTEKDRMKYFMYFPVTYKRDMEK